MSETEAKAFADRWLPAWTGNDPEGLVTFYSNDAVYSDPAVPNGVRGHDEILGYFHRLLARYPDWVWTNTRVRPLKRRIPELLARRDPRRRAGRRV